MRRPSRAAGAAGAAAPERRMNTSEKLLKVKLERQESGTGYRGNLGYPDPLIHARNRSFLCTVCPATSGDMGMAPATTSAGDNMAWCLC